MGKNLLRGFLAGGLVVATGLLIILLTQGLPDRSGGTLGVTNEPPAPQTQPAESVTCSPAQLAAIPEPDPAPGTAEPHVTTRNIVYDIFGDNAQAIRSQLDACGPRAGEDRHDAYADYRVKWAFQTHTFADGTCAVTNPSVGLNIQYYYPRWNPGPEVPNDLTNQWQSYSTRLEAHENEHGRIAVAGAKAVLERLKTLPGALSCDEASVSANNAAQVELDKLKARQAAYDVDTDHGAKQGVTFP